MEQKNIGNQREHLDYWVLKPIKTLANKKISKNSALLDIHQITGNTNRKVVFKK